MRDGRSDGGWAKAPEGWAHSRTLSRGRKIAGARNLAGLGMAAGCQPAIQPIANRRYSRTLRADRGGVAHGKVQGFRKFLGAPPLPGPLLHFEEWRRGGHGVLGGGWVSGGGSACQRFGQADGGESQPMPDQPGAAGPDSGNSTPSQGNWQNQECHTV